MAHQDIKSRLLARRLGTETIDIDGVGPVTVRGLSRDEGVTVSEAKTVPERDRLMLRFGLVDPVLDADEVAAWCAAAPAGEIERVSVKITELSKLHTGAPKESYKSL